MSGTASPLLALALLGLAGCGASDAIPSGRSRASADAGPADGARADAGPSEPIVLCASRLDGGRDRCALLQTADELWEVTLPSLERRPIGRPRRTLADVALHPDGTLYGIEGEDLVRFVPGSLDVRVVASIGEGAVGLAITPDGTVVAALGEGLWVLDPASGTFGMVARFPERAGQVLLASGDVTAYEGSVYATAMRPEIDGDFLVEVPIDGRPSRIVGALHARRVLGLFADGPSLYAAEESGEILAVDPATGRGTVITTTPLTILGAASDGAR